MNTKECVEELELLKDIFNQYLNVTFDHAIKCVEIVGGLPTVEDLEKIADNFVIKIHREESDHHEFHTDCVGHSKIIREYKKQLAATISKRIRGEG